MANINIKLNKNFITQFNKLSNQYGIEIAKLNGLSPDDLSFTDFIDAFVDTETVADASVDGNANVGNKDMRTLLNEMPKAHRKLLGYNKIHYELNKKYGFKTANEWLLNEWTRALYLHDADTATFKPYCYKGEEMLTISNSINGDNCINITFKELYNFALKENKERYDETIQNYAIFPKNLYVLDYNKDKEVWTKITRIVKHNNDKKMRFIKYANGLSQIVTEDHPIITSEGEKPANTLTTEDKVFTIAPSYFNKTVKKVYTSLTTGQEQNHFTKGLGEIILTKELGWLTGMILSEASSSPSSIVLPQSINSEQYNKIIYILNKYEIPYSINMQNTTIARFRIKVCPYSQYILSFMINQTSFTKSLPIGYNNYTDEFMDGIVAGMIDGDGTIDGYKHRHCQIRIASEQLCHQLSNYLATKNVFCGDRIPYRYKNEKSFEQKLPLFGIGFTLTDEEYFLNIDSIKINTLYEKRIRKGNFAEKKYNYNYGWVNIIDNNEYIDSCPIVYDITTETGHFICNNVLSHNCYAYSLKRLAEEGLFFLKDFNYEPAQHLTTFIDFVKEFVSYNSNLTSGACGLPDLIPYMYYFWKKDIADNYFTKSPKAYAEQSIQRFIYAVNQPAVRDSIQSAFTNVNFFDTPYLEALFGGSEFPDGTPMIYEIDEIMDFQKLFLEVMGKIRSKNMFTFPVSSISMIHKNKKFEDEDFARWAIKHNMKWYDSNLFFSDTVTSLSNCCRLKSNIEDLGFFSSIGGTALRVGSVKVSTINLARIAYESENEQEYLIKLRDLNDLNLKLLDTVRHIIKRNIEKKLLPNYCDGLIDLSTQYCTVGM